MLRENRVNDLSDWIPIRCELSGAIVLVETIGDDLLSFHRDTVELDFAFGSSLTESPDALRNHGIISYAQNQASYRQERFRYERSSCADSRATQQVD